MHIVVLGANHETAPIALRERLSFARSELAGTLRALAARGAAEAVAVTTCNRTEVYALWPSGDGSGLAGFLAESRGLPPEELEGCLYHLAERDAVAHIFRVACGIESMMVGEYQVLGQVREALEAAVGAGTAGTILRRLFETAVSVGRRARRETAIGQGAFSVGGCAVQLAHSVFGDLRGKRTLIVGAGKMSEATAKHLADQGADSVFVANRTYQRACQLAERFGGRAVRYDDLFEHLADVDIAIASTAAPHAIIRRDEMARVMRARRGRPLLLIDIAVPRDIEPAVGELGGAYLYNIDDLSAVVAQDATARQGEVGKVERIVQGEADEFVAWRTSLAVAPLITALRGKFEHVRQDQLERASAQLARMSPRDRELVRALTASIVNKLLHTPTVRLRRLLQDGDGDNRAQALRELFELAEEAEEPAEPCRPT